MAISMRSQPIPEHYVSLVQDKYNHISIQLGQNPGQSMTLEVRLYQGSELPFLFNWSMDKEIQSIFS